LNRILAAFQRLEPAPAFALAGQRRFLGAGCLQGIGALQTFTLNPYIHAKLRSTAFLLNE
jgi:hypothetical protein